MQDHTENHHPMTQLHEDPKVHSDQPNVVVLRDLARTFFEAVLYTIICSHQNYFKQKEDIEIDITLKKLYFTEDAAFEAKSILDLETSALSELVKDLIQGQVVENTKNVNAELEHLK